MIIGPSGASRNAGWLLLVSPLIEIPPVGAGMPAGRTRECLDSAARRISVLRSHYLALLSSVCRFACCYACWMYVVYIMQR